MPSQVSARVVVVVGASRGLGLAASEELLRRGWRVIATVRNPDGTPLADPAHPNADRIELITLDVNSADDIAKLHARLAPEGVDALYVNAGITGANCPVGDVATEEFVNVMVTNALAPMRLVEKLGACVHDGGTIAVVSSRQGSISLNTRGGHEVYRASKSALNQLMRSYAARGAYGNRTLLLLHPGWVQTPLGGDGAPFTPAESANGLVDVVEQHGADGGLQFLDHTGQPVAW